VKETDIRLTLKWWEALLVLVAAIAGSLGRTGNDGIGLLYGLAASIAFAAWRCVRILGHLLELKQAEMFEEDA
jgi:hypothetical protein